MNRRRHAQRGAALLLAMLILTLVATTAAGMAWAQFRAIEVETAERARAQAAWILAGALDFGRLILREDARDGTIDHLGEPWATGLEESRLSTFLAADRDNNAESNLEVFLSGGIVDAQSRYNLLNLIGDNAEPVAAEVEGLKRLCLAAGVAESTAAQIAQGMAAARAGTGPLMPTRVEQLAWFGLDPDTIARLQDYLVLLPVRTPVNANTAPREVLVAAIQGLDLAGAERIVQARRGKGLANLEDLRKLLSTEQKAEDARVALGSRFFEIQGRVRHEQRVLEERTLVERRGDRGLDVVALQRERRSLRLPAR